MSEVAFNALLGKTIVKITGLHNEEIVTFYCDDGTSYSILHEQDCCESVTLEDIGGYPDDLLNSPITLAEESSNNDWPTDVPKPEWLESFTWTYYRLGTAKGTVVLRWYGSSNGYYSERVSFIQNNTNE